jgi:hypothetical protein
MHVRATTAIEKGSQLFSCYTYTLNGTLDRQQHLMEGKYFQCRCERCLDPTELDTHFSSMKCSSCLFGDVSTTNPLGEFFDFFIAYELILICQFFLKMPKLVGRATSAHEKAQQSR